MCSVLSKQNLFQWLIKERDKIKPYMLVCKPGPSKIKFIVVPYLIRFHNSYGKNKQHNSLCYISISKGREGQYTNYIIFVCNY